MSKKKMRKDRAIMEIAKQKGNRNMGIIWICGGGVLAVFVIMGVPVLQQSGFLPYGNDIVSIVTFMTAIAACGILGLGVQKFSRANRTISGLRSQFGITDEEYRSIK